MITTETEITPSISWTAVIVGALVAVGLGFLLHLLTFGLGLSAFTTNPDGLTTLAVGGFIWLILTGYFSMFVAGWIAGMLVRPTDTYSGMLHGFAAWCLSLIIVLALAAHSGVFATDLTAQLNTTYPPVNTTQATHIVGVGMLATFFIFLIGACGNAVGGYLGARGSQNNCQQKL